MSEILAEWIGGKGAENGTKNMSEILAELLRGVGFTVRQKHL